MGEWRVECVMFDSQNGLLFLSKSTAMPREPMRYCWARVLHAPSLSLFKVRKEGGREGGRDREDYLVLYALKCER